MTRIPPVEPPYEKEIGDTLRRMMPPGMDPLLLFRAIAHNPNVLDNVRSTGAYLLNFGTVDPQEREIVLLRTCARCGAEYEWGVHVAFYARAVGLSDQQISSTVLGGPEDPSWSPRQALLMRLADELHDRATVSAELWEEIARGWTAPQIVELITVAGQYHAVSFLANALAVPLEAGAPRFPATAPSPG